MQDSDDGALFTFPPRIICWLSKEENYVQVNGYTIKGSSSAIFIFASLLNLDQPFKGKNLLPWEQSVYLISSPGRSPGRAIVLPSVLAAAALAKC